MERNHSNNSKMTVNRMKVAVTPKRTKMRVQLEWPPSKWCSKNQNYFFQSSLAAKWKASSETARGLKVKMWIRKKRRNFTQTNKMKRWKWNMGYRWSLHRTHHSLKTTQRDSIAKRIWWSCKRVTQPMNKAGQPLAPATEKIKIASVMPHLRSKGRQTMVKPKNRWLSQFESNQTMYTLKKKLRPQIWKNWWTSNSRHTVI